MGNEKDNKQSLESPDRRVFFGTLLAAPFAASSFIVALRQSAQDKVSSVLGLGPEQQSEKTPLVDTHMHVDCSITPEMIHAVGQKHEMPVFKGKSVQEIKPMIQSPKGSDWQTWYDHFKVVRKSYVSPKAIGDLTECVIRASGKSGVDLLEMRLSLLSNTAAMMENMGVKSEADYWKYAQQVFDQTLLAMDRVQGDPNSTIKTDLILSLSCSKACYSKVPDFMNFCRDNRRHIAGLDLTHEKDFPPSTYAGPLESVRGSVRHLTAHCMETEGPERGWDVLKLNPNRIGHGLRAIKDPKLVGEFARREIPFEMCVNNNIITGTVRDIKDHPVRRLYDAGVPLIVGTDGGNDGSAMADNYRLIQSAGFSQKEIDGLKRNSWKYAFRNMQK